MSDSTGICNDCLVDSGRFNASRRCCMVRGIANGPKERRTAIYERVLRTEGKEAANHLIGEVNAEARRLFALRQPGPRTLAKSDLEK